MFASPKKTGGSPLRPRTRSSTAALRHQQPPPQRDGSSPTYTTNSSNSSRKAHAGLGSLVKEYVIATRPWTFTASLVPILLAAVLLEAPLSGRRFLSALGAGLLVHAASNLTNTYYDFVSGRDTKKESGDRALVDRVRVTQRGVLLLALALYAASTALVASIVDHSQYRDLQAVFVAGALLSFLYTAWPFHLKCRALGDVVVYLCFGPLLFQFTALLVAPHPAYVAVDPLASWTEHIHWELMPYTVPIGLLTEGILHANNARDIEMDAKTGTLTLARLLGFGPSRQLFLLLLAGAYASSLYLALTAHVGNALVLLTLPLAAITASKFQEQTMELMPENVAKLHALYGLLTVAGVALTPWAEPAAKLLREMTTGGAGSDGR